MKREKKKVRTTVPRAGGNVRKKRRREWRRIPRPNERLLATVREHAKGRHESEAEDLIRLYTDSLSLAIFFQNVLPDPSERDDCIKTAALCKRAMYSYLRGRHRTPAGAERGEVDGVKRKYRKKKKRGQMDDGEMVECGPDGCGWRGRSSALRRQCGAFTCPACGLKIELPEPPKEPGEDDSE